MDAWSQPLPEGNCTFESVCTSLPAFCTQLSCTIHKSSQLTSHSTEHPMKTISISQHIMTEVESRKPQVQWIIPMP